MKDLAKKHSEFMGFPNEWYVEKSKTMTLLSKTLRVIKRDLVKKCLEISAETAEKIDDYIEFYEQSGKCLKRENHEQSSLKYVDRMKEGHNDIFFRLREYRRRVLVPASVGEKEHDAGHVRDDQRAHHARDEPGRFVSVCFKMHNGHRDGLLCTFQQRWSSKGKYDESGPPEMFSVRSRPINSFRMCGAELGSLTDDDIGSRGAAALTLEPASASLLE